MYFICLTPEAKSKVTINPTEHTEETFFFFLLFVPVRFKCFVCLSPCRRCRRRLTGAGASLPLWLLGNRTTRKWVWANRRGRPVCQWVRTHSCSLLVRRKDPQLYTHTHRVHHTNQQQARVSISNRRYNLRILSQYFTERCDNISDNIGKKQNVGECSSQAGGYIIANETRTFSILLSQWAAVSGSKSGSVTVIVQRSSGAQWVTHHWLLASPPPCFNRQHNNMMSLCH